MKILFSDTHKFEKDVFTAENKDYGFDIEYIDYRLTSQIAKGLGNADVVCSFVSDKLDRECLKILKDKGVKLVALRSAGFNHIDLKAAQEFGMSVCRVPGYSPYAVAEFAVGLLLTLNRKIHKAYNRVRESNFALDGLVGFDLHGKTVGVVGAGRIGKIFAKIMSSFGCQIRIFDQFRDPELESMPNCKYVTFDELCKTSDVISLHVPLSKETLHLINEHSMANMKPGVVLINTGRGAVIDTKALIKALKKGAIGGAALDVYEEEEEIFFHDLSGVILQDDVLARLLTFPNVLMTSHQAFLTHEALQNIAQTTLESIKRFSQDGSIPAANRVEL